MSSVVMFVQVPPLAAAIKLGAVAALLVVAAVRLRRSWRSRNWSRTIGMLSQRRSSSLQESRFSLSPP